MSAVEGPTPDELAAEFPLSPDEAQALADAMVPLQSVTDAGSSVGKAMEDIPGPGPRLVGVVLQNIATHADLMSVSVRTLARAVEFYLEAQTQSLSALFPPPEVALAQMRQDAAPLARLVARPPEDPL